MAVHPDRARCRVVEPGEQLDDGRLARAGGTDQGNGFARCDAQAESVQYFPTTTARVAEGHCVELELPAQLLYRQGVFSGWGAGRGLHQRP